MQLDEEDLKLLHDLANRRELLSRRGSAALGMGRPMREVMKRRIELQQEAEALADRFLNKGLRAAGLPHAIDPATLPDPPVHHPLTFAYRPALARPRPITIPTNHDR